MKRENRLNNQKLLIGVLTLILFCDFLSSSIVLPLFPGLILDSNSYLLTSSVDEDLKPLIMSILFGAFGAGLFFASPIMGELSDRYGRRRILLYSLSFQGLACFTAALSLYLKSIILFLLFRLMSGAAAGIWAVLSATITDICKPHKRSTYLGYLTGGACAGFTIGPFLGSRLSNPDIVPWFTWCTPFWFMLSVFIAVFMLSFVIIPETNHNEYGERINILAGIDNLKNTFKIPGLKILFLIFFFHILSVESFYCSFPIFAYNQLSQSHDFTGNAFMFIGVFSAFSILFLNKKLSYRYHSAQIFPVLSFSMIFLYLGFLFVKSKLTFILLISVFGFMHGLAWTHCLAMISGAQENPKMQGKIMGINQSLHSAAIVIGPIMVGIMATLEVKFILILSCIWIGISFTLLNVYLWKNRPILLKPVLDTDA